MLNWFFQNNEFIFTSEALNIPNKDEYTIIKSDQEFQINKIYSLVDGVITITGERPPLSHEQLVEAQWGIIREERNKLLTSTDWTQLPDVPVATKNLWEPYRQALRDVTNQSDPYNIAWPIPPKQ